MMLAIVNVTVGDTQEFDDYEIRINKKVIGAFKHKRAIGGAAQCLRDAADSLDANPHYRSDKLLEQILKHLAQFNTVLK